MSILTTDAWVEITDPDTNIVFFANPQTGEYAWEKPENIKLHQKDPTGEWWEFYDEKHQLPYYYHPESHQTEWTAPKTGTIISLKKFQNTSIGKRMSVALIPSDDMDVNQMQLLNVAMEASMTTSLDLSPGMLSSRSAFTKSIENLTTITGSLSSYSKQDTSNSTNTQVPGTRDTNSPDITKAETDYLHHRNSADEGETKLSQKSPDNSLDESNSSDKAMPPRPNTPISEKTVSSRDGEVSQLKHDSNSGSSSESLNSASSKKHSKSAVNFEDMTKTSNRYSGLGRKRFSYQVHTRKLSTGEVKIMPQELQQDIAQFSIDGFARKYFDTHNRGIFRKKVPVEKMLLHQKESLKRPLLVLSPTVKKDATKCFKAIQRIMGDKRRSGGPTDILEDIRWLLDRGIFYGELRDEIYVQICKQLTKNPNGESIKKGWELLCVLAITFPPSKNFEVYLMQFVSEHFSIKENRVNVLSKHVHSRLSRTCRLGPRGKVLTMAEIERAKEAPFNPSVFGESLEFIMKLQEQTHPELKVPRILLFLTDAILELKGQSSEGIFRVPGDSEFISELKLRIEKNRYDISGITDPNVPSSLLKFWLRDLADPLIPVDFYDRCIKHAEDEDLTIEIVKSLPEINKRVVVYTIDFLQKFYKPETMALTKMNTHNLAMCFAPNFLRCPSDNLPIILENTKYEQTFVKTLLLNLRSKEMTVDDNNTATII